MVTIGCLLLRFAIDSNLNSFITFSLSWNRENHIDNIKKMLM